MQILVKELSKNCRVTVFTLQYPFRKEEYLWNGIPVISLGGANKKYKKGPILNSSLKKEFSKKHRQTPFDVIHSFWLGEAATMGGKLAKLFDLPHVATAMGQDVLPSNKRLKSVLSSNVKVVSISSFQNDRLLKAGHRDAQLIPLGIENISLEEKEFEIVSVGSLIDLKNFDYLLDICEELKKSGIGFKAKIIGDGPNKRSLKERLIGLELEDELELMGEVDYPQTLQLISKAKILVQPSVYEGFGMTIIEALASSTHILSFPVGVAPEVEEANYLTGSVSEDVKKIQELLNKTAMEARLYNVADCVTDYLELYKSLV